MPHSIASSAELWLHCPSQPLESPVLPDGVTPSSPSFPGRSGYFWISASAALPHLAAFSDNPELNAVAFLNGVGRGKVKIKRESVNLTDVEGIHTARQ